MITAWFGESDLKSAVMERLREHRRMDTIVQGVYFNDGRGCHLGCITHASKNTHRVAERLFGIEQRVGYWLEIIFERLPKEDCAAWVLESTEAIPVGADLSRCHHHFCAWLLGPSELLTITDDNRDAIEAVRVLHQRAASGLTVTDEQWSAARSAWASWSAQAASARSAAESAQVASAQAASETWKKIAAKSIEIFAAAPIVGAQTMDTSVREELCCRKLWCPETQVALASGTRCKSG